MIKFYRTRLEENDFEELKSELEEQEGRTFSQQKVFEYLIEYHSKTKEKNRMLEDKKTQELLTYIAKLNAEANRIYEKKMENLLMNVKFELAIIRNIILKTEFNLSEEELSKLKERYYYEAFEKLKANELYLNMSEIANNHIKN